MFTIEERNLVRDRVLEMSKADGRLVSCAAVGSTATGGDRWSDLDFAFGLAGDAKLADVLDDWMERLKDGFGAVHLFDFHHQSTVYRVFLLPGNLQLDMSFTPGAEFGALGPRFALLFGKAVEKNWSPPPTPLHLFGYAVHHLVRARTCIERGRFWQAEYWISAARDYVLSLACLHRGLNASYGRGFDDLPEEIVKPFTETLVRSIERRQLVLALGRTVDELLRNSQDVQELASRLSTQLLELKAPTME
jgi:hypothetical protein